MAVIASLASLLAACTGGERETPGDRANAKLAGLLQAELDAEIQRMNPSWAPGLIAAAPEHARQWLREIDDVVARCRYGPRNRGKGNVLEYDITLRNGERMTGVPSGQRCLYGIAPPLVMRVRFANGRVAEALSDGREREGAVDAVSVEVQQFASRVIRHDWERRPALYFPPSPSAEDVRRGWDTPSR